MELGHILLPSDPGIQQPGDPVDPVTLFCNELHMPTNVADKRLHGQEVCQFLSLFGVCTLLERKILKIVLNVNISMTVGRIFTKKYLSLYLHLGLFFENRKNSGLTPG